MGFALVETAENEREVVQEDASLSAPVVRASRIASLDFIRGLAVMGILAANIVAFGQPFGAYMYPDGFLVPTGDPNGWLWIAQFVLVDGKMRGLFTLLFGAGLYLFMERAWAQGQTRWLQARRLFWLGLFGLLHYFVIWRGDILFYYAVIGGIVLLTLRWSASTQWRVGFFSYIGGSILYAVMMAPLPLVADTKFGEQEAFSAMREGLAEGKSVALADDRIEAELVQSGDFAGVIAHRFNDHLTEPLSNLTLFGLEMLPLMLMGVALFRMGMFSGEFDSRRMRFWGWTGVVAGGLAHLAIGLWVQGGGFTYYGTLAAFMGLSALPRLAMVIGLAALLTLCARSASGWLGQRIIAAGRTAFTNYLGTSVLMLFVFHGWALGLFGKLNRPELYLVMVCTWAIMLLWSKPWLERFRYGPLEWLWRCLTYGKVLAFKR
ncbi:DUF418 domain-containing protein [Altererythrobacter sp. GH1-8]|uniref:DUF418 domain-containing protein n=1 Tax=Altererythrobacter sp. GH1-8 TaxID=3349333 RepID=UPI00374DDB3C